MKLLTLTSTLLMLGTALTASAQNKVVTFKYKCAGDVEVLVERPLSGLPTQPITVVFDGKRNLMAPEGGKAGERYVADDKSLAWTVMNKVASLQNLRDDKPLATQCKLPS